MSEPAAMFPSFYRRTFLLVTALALGYALYRVLEPLLSALAWAVVLAFILHPLHEWLGTRLRGRTTLSAGLITTLTPFLVLAPLAALGVAFAEQVARLIIFLRGHPLLSYEDLLNRLSRTPVIGPEVSWARDSIPVSVDQVQSWLTGSIETLLKSAASVGGGLALGAFGTLVSFFMMLFMLFFFLKDGRAMLEGLARLIPVERAPRTRLLKYLGDVTRAVVFGSAATAVIQGVVIGIGFAIVGVCLLYTSPSPRDS